MKHYETMFIVKPTLVEDEIKSKIEFYKEAITKNGGEIATCLDMGMRHLAYEIKKNKRGYYFVIYFKAEPSLILELERLYRINEDILRFIVVKYENKREQKAWETLIDKANNPQKYAKKTLKKDDASRPVRRRPEEKAESLEQVVENVSEQQAEGSAE